MKNISIIITFFIIMMVASANQTYMHEQVHGSICASADPTQEIKYGFSIDGLQPYFYTQCENYGSPGLHELNEIIGYNMTSLYVLLGFGMMAMAIIINENGRRQW